VAHTAIGTHLALVGIACSAILVERRMGRKHRGCRLSRAGANRGEPARSAHTGEQQRVRHDAFNAVPKQRAASDARQQPPARSRRFSPLRRRPPSDFAIFVVINDPGTGRVVGR
jgi:hypothetical protein